jgi:hypothetical protein
VTSSTSPAASARSAGNSPSSIRALTTSGVSAGRPALTIATIVA